MAEKAKPRGQPPKVAKTTHKTVVEEHPTTMKEGPTVAPAPQMQPKWKYTAKLIPEDEELTQTNQSMETNESQPQKSPTNQNMSPSKDQSESDTTSEEESSGDHRQANSTSPNREGERQKRQQQTSHITRDILLTRGISEADLQRWEEMDLSCEQINRWHKEGFCPAKAALWNQEGFLARKARQWKAIRCTNKISPEASLEWIQGGLSIYKAVEYHMASVPSTFLSAIRALGMQAEVLSEFFDSFQIGKVAMEWEKCGITPKEAGPWIKATFSHKEAQSWSYTGIAPGNVSILKKNNWNPTMVGQWGPLKKWSQEEATKWMAGGFKAHEMMYWKAKEVSLKDTAEWARMGAMSTTHMAMGETPITAD
ncbi:hypothetical protein DSO57_1009984 [Entomophthora muscae]|uniref:Uncharacterized protein n=1 Tax=Entomophthora muscae TaxID=34485 RepID=A0ACC2URX6_9FUNG|nr:hypothetical protein DSO57_1009984 [Entomophthora muscae]